MVPIRHLIPPLALMLTAIAARGEGGQLLPVHHDGRTRYLLEQQSIRGDGQERSCTLRREFSGDDERVSARDTVEFDCDRALYRFRDIVIYDRDDDVMHRYRLTDQYSPVPDGSYLELLRQLVCAPPCR